MRAPLVSLTAGQTGGDSGRFQLLRPAGAGRPDACARSDLSGTVSDGTEDRRPRVVGAHGGGWPRRGLQACEFHSGGVMRPRLVSPGCRAPNRTRVAAAHGSSTGGPAAPFSTAGPGRADCAPHARDPAPARSSDAVLHPACVLSVASALPRRPGPAAPPPGRGPTRSASGRCAPSRRWWPASTRPTRPTAPATAASTSPAPPGSPCAPPCRARCRSPARSPDAAWSWSTTASRAPPTSRSRRPCGRRRGRGR